MNRKQHWENIYNTKKFTDVSWYQPTPQTSLDFISDLNISKDAAIIDVGGGDSFLVDHLLKNGFTNITILDISEAAIEKAKKRLGKESEKVSWINSDITNLSTGRKFDFWHDRAAFHFLTSDEEIKKYLSIAEKNIVLNGKMLIGTFSTEGPEICSGLPVKQYNEKTLSQLLSKWFHKIKCITEDHLTPFKTKQNFLFCGFSKINIQ